VFLIKIGLGFTNVQASQLQQVRILTMALNTPFTTGQVLTAAQQNGLAFGYVANSVVTSAQTGITTETDLTGLTATWTAQADRIYMVVAVLNAYGVDEEWANIYLNINGSNVRAYRSAFSRTNGFNTEMYQHQFTVAAGSCTAKLRMARENAGAAAVNNYADGSFQASISVIDLGER
jgi:hypothetical protein